MCDAQQQGSEVARLLRQIGEEYESALRGIGGLAYGTSKHAFVTRKMENMGQLHEELATLVGERSAITMVVEQLESCSDSTHSSVQQPDEETHTLLEQMQQTDAPVLADPLPVPEQLQLGHTSITVNNQEFIEAIGYGLESYFEGLGSRTQMSAQELFERWMKGITRDRVPFTNEPLPDSWRLGFLIGEVAGFLNPDLGDADPALPYLESLSRKCQRLYQSLTWQSGVEANTVNPRGEA